MTDAAPVLSDGEDLTILQGDCMERLRELPDDFIHCCVTSPPYWGLRDYGIDGQLGLEETPGAYVSKMVEVFREVRRVLRSDGTLWLNLGDSYASGARSSGSGCNGGESSTLHGGRRKLWLMQETQDKAAFKRAKTPGLKPKDLVGIPWRVAFALQADGWWLRQDIIWAKPDPLPESVTDRCTKSHEYIFLLTKQGTYYFDAKAIEEPALWPLGPSSPSPKWVDARNAGGAGNVLQQSAATCVKPRETRNKRSVWTVATSGYADAHFATFPTKLISPCIRAGCPVGGLVLDPFGGSGTTGAVALELRRQAVLVELNPEYIDMIRARCLNVTPMLFP